MQQCLTQPHHERKYEHNCTYGEMIANLRGYQILVMVIKCLSTLTCVLEKSEYDEVEDHDHLVKKIQ